MLNRSPATVLGLHLKLHCNANKNVSYIKWKCSETNTVAGCWLISSSYCVTTGTCEEDWPTFCKMAITLLLFSWAL